MACELFYVSERPTDRPSDRPTDRPLLTLIMPNAWMVDGWMDGGMVYLYMLVIVNDIFVLSPSQSPFFNHSLKIENFHFSALHISNSTE